MMQVKTAVFLLLAVFNGYAADSIAQQLDKYARALGRVSNAEIATLGRARIQGIYMLIESAQDCIATLSTAMRDSNARSVAYIHAKIVQIQANLDIELERQPDSPRCIFDASDIQHELKV